MTERAVAVPIGAPPGSRNSLGVFAHPYRTTANARLFFYVAVLASTVVASFTANPLLSAAAVLVFAFLVALFWRPGQPPILLWTVLFPWLQVSTAIFQADFAGTTVAATSLRVHAEDAIWLSLVGLATLAIGLRIGARSVTAVPPSQVDAQLARVSLTRLFAVYLVFACIGMAVPRLEVALPSIAQIVQRIVNIKWAFFFLLGYLTLRRRTDRFYFLVAVILEFLSGIGFFAEFQLVFFVGSLVILTVHYRLTWKSVLVASAGAIVMVFMALAWTHVKREYRAFLNQGTNMQVSLVSPTERLGTFVSLTRNVSTDDLENAMDPLLDRIAYVDYFAAAMDYVPSRRPYERGNLLMQDILHVLHPRFLYPDKAPLSDSEITAMYTGLAVAGADRGTSISIGFMGESYIDFGSTIMFLPILIVGIIWGLAYAYFARYPVRGIGHAFSVAMLLYADEFVGMSGPKLLGGTITDFVLLALFLRYVMPSLFSWLQVRSTNVQR